MDYEPMCGTDITTACGELVALAETKNKSVCMKFNDQEITARPGDTPSSLAQAYSEECDRSYKEYINSDAHKEAERKRIEEQKHQDAELADALAGAPEHMSLRDPDGWAEAVRVNDDSYGGGVIKYAERWARLMEAAMTAGAAIDCAKRTSHLADNEGITDFMYGAAVSTLAQVWEHGEALRRWHNLDSQIGDEGERANESGGTLNPALLNIGVK